MSDLPEGRHPPALFPALMLMTENGFPHPFRGGSKNFSKGGFYTIVVTFNANGVEGE